MTKKTIILIGASVFIAVAALITAASRHHQVITPPPQPTEGYIALGDSVAAGVGLKNDSDASACNRTNQAYPNLLANKLHYRLTNLACSGATIPAGIIGSQDVNQLQVPSQLAQLFSKPIPKLITITTGANDAQWTTLIGKCYSGECGSADDSAGVTISLNALQLNLESMLSQLQAKYGRTIPRVVLSGYYQVFPTTLPVNCPDLTGIDASELMWGRAQQSAINATLQEISSAHPFVLFVPIDFSGHELCSTNSWVQGLADKQPDHPTEAGQSAIARQINSALAAQKAK